MTDTIYLPLRARLDLTLSQANLADEVAQEEVEHEAVTEQQEQDEEVVTISPTVAVAVDPFAAAVEEEAVEGEGVGAREQRASMCNRTRCRVVPCLSLWSRGLFGTQIFAAAQSRSTSGAVHSLNVLLYSALAMNRASAARSMSVQQVTDRAKGPRHAPDDTSTLMTLPDPSPSLDMTLTCCQSSAEKILTMPS